MPLWTSDEKAEIRYRLGIDGPVKAPTVNVPNVIGPDPKSFTPVDHNSGGPNNLAYLSHGSGVLGGRVRAYKTSDWSSGNRAEQFVEGEVYTDSDGAWLSPMMLPVGDYTFLYTKDGLPGVSTKSYTAGP